MTDEEFKMAEWASGRQLAPFSYLLFPSMRNDTRVSDVVRELRAVTSQRDALLRALSATLESHDIGHSPCDCIEVRAVVASVRAALAETAPPRGVNSNGGDKR